MGTKRWTAVLSRSDCWRPPPRRRAHRARGPRVRFAARQAVRADGADRRCQSQRAPDRRRDASTTCARHRAGTTTTPTIPASSSRSGTRAASGSTTAATTRRGCTTTSSRPPWRSSAATRRPHRGERSVHGVRRRRRRDPASGPAAAAGVVAAGRDPRQRHAQPPRSGDRVRGDRRLVRPGRRPDGGHHRRCGQPTAAGAPDGRERRAPLRHVRRP